MRVLLSGGQGFIGTHLRNRLSSLKSISRVYKLDHQYLYYPYELGKILNEIKPDYIFHLASYGNHYFQTEEDKVYKANVNALFNLLEASKGLKLRYFANFATTHHNLESGSPYGSTKAAGEYLVRMYVAKYNLPIVNIRPYSIYGEYEWDFRFIPTISRQIKEGHPITVSSVNHDWTYVEDFITILLQTIPKINHFKGLSVGIGTGKRISNIRVARTLMKVINKNVDIVKGVKRSYEIASYTKKLLSNKGNTEIFIKADFTPLAEGLRRVYESNRLWLRRE